MTRMLHLLCAALSVGCCLLPLEGAGCHREPDAYALFPCSNEAAGWVKSGETRTFEAANLWKYIDGEAERYLKAGVHRLSTADYKYQKKFDVVVDIYSMESTEGPKKIFDSEPTGDEKRVQLGDGARLYDQSLIFRERSYLVRITAYQPSSGMPQALLELGRVIEERITR